MAKNKINYDIKGLKGRRDKTKATRKDLASQDQSQLSSYQKDYVVPRNAKGGSREKGIDRKIEARQGMKASGYQGKDASNFDSAAYGNKKFGNADVKAMQQHGFSDKQIKKHVAGLDRSEVGGSVRNNADIAGKHAAPKLDGSKDIGSQDVGKRYNKADITRMQNAGYSDKDIRKDMVSRGQNVGATGAKFLDKGGEYDNWKNAKERAQGQKDNPAPVAPTPTPSPSPSPSPAPPSGSGSQQQNVTQDNDIVNNISGDNNNVKNNQDNSVNQMGGSTSTSGTPVTPESQAKADDLKDQYVSTIQIEPNPEPGSSRPSDGMPQTQSPAPTNTNVQNVDSSQEQNVNQDNDITNDISGNNNYVNNNQDNSVRNYGGDTRVFNYQGGSNPATDTPASAATMAGFYDVDDSPSKQASFVDMFSTINKDAQKKYADTSSIAAGAKFRAQQNKTVDLNALDKRIADREQYSRAKSDMMGMNLFGDMFAGNGPSWNSAKPQTEVEKPDFEKMYDTYKP